MDILYSQFDDQVAENNAKNYTFMVFENATAQLLLHGPTTGQEQDEVVQLVANNPKLQKFSIGLFYDERQGDLLSKLCKVLANFEKLTQFSINKGNLSQQNTALAIGPLIRANHHIYELHISNCTQNKTANDFFGDLATFIPTSQLKTIILNNNDLGTAQALAILQAANQNQHLVHLDLQHNDIGKLKTNILKPHKKNHSHLMKKFALRQSTVVVLGPMLSFSDKFRKKITPIFNNIYRQLPPENDYNVALFLQKHLRLTEDYCNLCRMIANELNSLAKDYTDNIQLLRISGELLLLADECSLEFKKNKDITARNRINECLAAWQSSQDITHIVACTYVLNKVCLYHDNITVVDKNIENAIKLLKDNPDQLATLTVLTTQEIVNYLLQQYKTKENENNDALRLYFCSTLEKTFCTTIVHLEHYLSTLAKYINPTNIDLTILNLLKMQLNSAEIIALNKLYRTLIRLGYPALMSRYDELYQTEHQLPNKDNLQFSTRKKYLFLPLDFAKTAKLTGKWQTFWAEGDSGEQLLYRAAINPENTDEFYHNCRAIWQYLNAEFVNIKTAYSSNQLTAIMVAFLFLANENIDHIITMLANIEEKQLILKLAFKYLSLNYNPQYKFDHLGFGSLLTLTKIGLTLALYKVNFLPELKELTPLLNDKCQDQFLLENTLLPYAERLSTTPYSDHQSFKMTLETLLLILKPISQSRISLNFLTQIAWRHDSADDANALKEFYTSLNNLHRPIKPHQRSEIANTHPVLADRSNPITAENNQREKNNMMHNLWRRIRYGNQEDATPLLAQNAAQSTSSKPNTNYNS